MRGSLVGSGRDWFFFCLFFFFFFFFSLLTFDPMSEAFLSGLGLFQDFVETIDGDEDHDRIEVRVFFWAARVCKVFERQPQSSLRVGVLDSRYAANLRDDELRLDTLMGRVVAVLP